jgi:hypothetical protein
MTIAGEIICWLAGLQGLVKKRIVSSVGAILAALSGRIQGAWHAPALFRFFPKSKTGLATSEWFVVKPELEENSFRAAP